MQTKNNMIELCGMNFRLEGMCIDFFRMLQDTHYDKISQLKELIDIVEYLKDWAEDEDDINLIQNMVAEYFPEFKDRIEKLLVLK